MNDNAHVAVWSAFELTLTSHGIESNPLSDKPTSDCFHRPFRQTNNSLRILGWQRQQGFSVLQMNALVQHDASAPLGHNPPVEKDGMRSCLVPVFSMKLPRYFLVKAVW